MLSNDLATVIEPFRISASRTAAASIYRAIELSPERIKACSSHALLESKVAIGIPETVFVDAMGFLSIVQSLPSKSEMSMTVSNGAVKWKCGPASGSLAVISVTNTPELPQITRGRKLSVNKAFGRALERGCLSADSEALGAIGLYGVTMRSSNSILEFASSDNMTLSYSTFPSISNFPDIATLPTKGALLLSAIINDVSTLEFVDSSIICRTGRVSCLIKQVPPLGTNLWNIVDQYSTTDIVTALPQDRMAAFIKRANALTESKRHTQVIMGAADGRITLSFAEGTAASDEYILADDLGGFPNIEPVSIPASKAARTLSYIDSLVLDHIHRSIIVFKGGDSFKYIISGTPPNK